MILIAFLFVTPFNAFAETRLQQIANNSSDSITQSNIDSSLTESDSAEEDISEPLLDNNVIISESVQEITAYSATAGISSGAVYRIKNVGSGKYLNVHYGVDANATNVYQWTGDGSTEQKFKVVYSSATDSYKIYAMCSSSGTNRVLDVVRNGAALSHGQNIDIWTPVDATAQEMKIVSLGSNQYRISMRANQNLYLASYGNSNGTSGGTAATSAGNVYLSNYVGEIYQHWMFELVDGGGTTAATPTGWLDSVSSTSVSGWAWRSDIPNTAIDVHVYIRNSSGQNVSIFALTANQYRGDLVSAGYGNGYHGFSGTINWSNFVPGIYNVTVYAIGYNGNNPALQGCPKNYLVSSTIGYKGYAVYRDLASPGMGTVSDNWHSGLMDEPYATNYKPVIHVSGLGSSVVDWIGWSDFIGDETYHGVYRPRYEMSDYNRVQVVNLARELRTKDIGYILTNQMRATIMPDATWIYPDDIVDLRCDGLIEYCYEYYGFRIYGDDNRWDITRASAENLAHHNLSSISPKVQAQNYMTLVTFDVPNP